MDVGIDAIAFSTTQHYLDMSELAVARDVEPSKYTHGLGQQHMSIASPLEDTVHLAINAGLKALKQFVIDPEEIATLVVGTETGVDHSKPVAVYVHHALGLPSNCVSYETKHACFGAMAAIESAIDWISSGRAKGRKALIIAADIANYETHTAAEPTQGAGAVAMVISEKPRLLAFNQDVRGHFTRNVMDFWRPLYAKEAIADGHYSIDCYLTALQESLTDAGSEVPRVSDLSAALYHVPFVKMAAKAHKKHLEYCYGQSIEKESEVYLKYLASYQAKTAPWLRLNAQVGNIYTASLFLSLINLLIDREVPAEQPILLFSYGSGCASSLCVANLVSDYDQWVDMADPSNELSARKKLSITQYEEWMRMRNSQERANSILQPEKWGLTAPYLYLGNKDHVRQYSHLN